MANFDIFDDQTFTPYRQNGPKPVDPDIAGIDVSLVGYDDLVENEFYELNGEKFRAEWVYKRWRLLRWNENKDAHLHELRNHAHVLLDGRIADESGIIIGEIAELFEAGGNKRKQVKRKQKRLQITRQRTRISPRQKNLLLFLDSVQRPTSIESVRAAYWGNDSQRSRRQQSSFSRTLRLLRDPGYISTNGRNVNITKLGEELLSKLLAHA